MLTLIIVQVATRFARVGKEVRETWRKLSDYVAPFPAQRRSSYSPQVQASGQRSSCPGRSAKRVFALDVPGIHVRNGRATAKNVDGRDIGERKRRRPSDGYARP